AARRRDERHLAVDEVGHQRRYALIAPFQPMVFDRHVLTFDVSRFPQAFAKRGHIARGGVSCPAIYEGDHRDCRLLRAGRDRPRRRDAEKADEPSPPQIEHQAAPAWLRRWSVYRRSACCGEPGKSLGW